LQLKHTALPLVSIITPSYNQAEFLEQTIQSVLLQDYAPIEYIVIDGSSSDGSLEIIHRYADRLAWWLSEPDRGQAEAINKGFQRARGEIVAWINSDDIYLPGAIAGAVAALEANPALGMVYSDAITIDSHGRPLNRLTFGDWGLAELAAFRIICQPTVFMRRTALEQAGFLEPTYHFMLDHHLWLRLARMAPIQHISQTWAAARNHPGAKNVKQASGFCLETQRVLEWILSQPDLGSRKRRSASRFASRSNGRKIFAGAYRLQARYYLDAGQPAPALRYYARALLNNPAFAMKHWHRMLYAVISLLGGSRLADRLYQRWLVVRYKKMVEQSGEESVIYNLAGLGDWPGLCLEAKVEK
jgi:glycosyltransferase involved in cell wall biosynthesis